MHLLTQCVKKASNDFFLFISVCYLMTRDFYHILQHYRYAEKQMRAPPVLIFDGDCGYCRKWISRWRKWNAQTQYISYQDYSKTHTAPALEDLRKAVHLIEGDQTYRAAHAVFRLLRLHPAGRCLYGLYESIPPFRWISESVYRGVARIRRRLSGPGATCDMEEK